MRLLGVAAVAAMVAGCQEAGDRPATWSYVYPAVVGPSCATATCHSALAARAGLVLDDADDAYAVLLDGVEDGGPFVFPGAAAESPLVLVLRGRERVQMPPGAPLPDGDLELIERWIDEGAER